MICVNNQRSSALFACERLSHNDATAPGLALQKSLIHSVRLRMEGYCKSVRKHRGRSPVRTWANARGGTNGYRSIEPTNDPAISLHFKPVQAHVERVSWRPPRIGYTAIPIDDTALCCLELLSRTCYPPVWSDTAQTVTPSSPVLHRAVKHRNYIEPPGCGT